MKILIAGYYGFDNSGDDLILFKMIEDLKNIYNDCEIVVWSGNKERTESLYGVNAVNRFSVNETEKAVRWADVVIVGGGGLIHEYFTLDIKDLFTSFGYNVAAYVVIPLFAKLYEKPLFYWAHGIGPIFSKSAKQFCKLFYSFADCITVRDEFSYSFLRNLGYENVYLDTDPVLGISIDNILKESDVKINTKSKVVGINLRPWFGYKKALKEIKEAFKDVLKKDNVIFIPVPFDLKLDKKVLIEFFKELKGDSSYESDLLNRIDSFFDVVALVNQVDVFVGTRLHSVMVSRLLNKPTIAFAYDKKVEAFAESLKIPYLYMGNLNSSELSNMLNELVNCPMDYEKIDIDYKTPEVFENFIKGYTNKNNRCENYQNIITNDTNDSNFYESFIQSIKDELNVINEEKEKLYLEKTDLQTKIEKLTSQLDQVSAEKADLQTKIEKLENEKGEIVKKFENLLYERNNFFNQLDQIYSSDFWKVASFYYRLRSKAPLKYIHKTLSILRREGVKGLSKRIDERIKMKFSGIKNTNKSAIPAKIIDEIKEKKSVKNTNKSAIPLEFNPYKALKLLKPIDVVAINKDYFDIDLKNSNLKFSVVVPVKNEENSIVRLLNDLRRQSLRPEEIIFVDGGSEDKTVEIIKNFSRENDLNIKLIETGIGNIGKQRNIGIKEARNELIVLIDAGNVLTESLCQNLVGVLTDYPDVDLVGTIYHPTKKSYWAYKFIWDWDNMDYTTYLPSGKAMLIKKSKALSIGGFPEYLTYAGEDTLFVINYRKVSKRWIINKNAVVYWEAPENKEQALKKAFLYGKGDGENGIGEFRLYDKLIKYIRREKVDFKDSVEKIFFEGYIEGRENRINRLIDKLHLAGNVLVLSGIPLTDSGGGQRGTQIALDLIEKRYKVTFCNVYPSFEKNKDVFLDVDYPLLELYSLKDFSIEDYIRRHERILHDTIVLLEFPHPDFIPIIKRFKSFDNNTVIIYDCIDNWHSDLGWVWYTKEKELEIIESADILVASAKNLKQKLEKLTDKPVHLLPNAVNTRLFRKDTNYSIPKDLPVDKPIIMYVGAMWGKWFDWELIEYIASKLNANIILIGNAPDDKIELSKKYSNIKFMGLKPQYKLPEYISCADVCIIPFKYDDEIIKYTNPLKVYEYLAMDKPVVSSYMDEIVGIPCVFIAENYKDFVFSIDKVLKNEVKCDFDKVKEFVRQNSWSERTNALLNIINDFKETKS